MAFGEMNAKNLAKSLLNLHRKEDRFDVRFASEDQTRAVAQEFEAIGCSISMDLEKCSVHVVRPVGAKAEVN